MLTLGNVLIFGKCASFGRWRISHLRYSLYSIDSSIRIGLSLKSSSSQTKHIFVMGNLLFMGVLVMRSVLFMGNVLIMGVLIIGVLIMGNMLIMGVLIMRTVLIMDVRIMSGDINFHQI